MDYREKVNKAFADAKGDDGLAWDLRDFLAVKVPAPEDGDAWGNWTFKKRDLTLQYRNAENYTYEIDLEQLDENLGVLIWLKDLSHKVFMTPEDVGNFFIAIQDLTDLWWMPDTNHRIDSQEVPKTGCLTRVKT
jgi:hypothetical protein